MMNKLTITLLAAATALTAYAAKDTYKVSLMQNSNVEGKQLKAGDYKVEIKDNNTAVLKHGKDVVEVPARELTAAHKYQATEVQYDNQNDLQEIHIGGTQTRIVFASGTGSAGAE